MKNKLILVIGDKHLSSWSMRPWLVLKAAKIPFQEIKIELDRPNTKAKIKKHSPSGKVPLLVYGSISVWDSLAIIEYIYEEYPHKNILPVKTKDRAIARSCMAEMHSSFQGLRSELSMNLKLKTRLNHMSSNTISDIQRIISIWESLLKKSDGPFLFGKFCAVDAFFAPVVFRFKSYGIQIKDKSALKYIKSVEKHPAVREWVRSAQKEKPAPIKF